VLREYEDFYNSHGPHRALDQAAPLRALPDGVTDLDHFRVRRHDRVGDVIHEYRLLAQVFGTHRARAAGIARSAQSGLGRAIWRRSTITP
jgi:hypothetical protein